MVRDSAAAGVAYGGTGGRLVGSRWSALRRRGGRRRRVDAMSSLSEILKESVGSVEGSSTGVDVGIGSDVGGAATRTHFGVGIEYSTER